MKQIEDKQKAIKYLRDDVYCTLDVSTIAKIGLFALKTIPKDIDPIKPYEEYGWLILHDSDAESIHPNVRHKFSEKMFSPRNTKIFILDFCDYLSQYINHSTANPNVKPAETPSGLITTRVVDEGEELLLDFREMRKYLEKNFNWKCDLPPGINGVKK